MRYLILAGLLLMGCGGGGSSLPVTETIIEQVPIIERECEEPETIYIVEEVIKEVYVYVEQNVTEPEPEIHTYYLISTATRDGDSIQDRVYDEQGYLISDYNELKDTWYKYTYDDNKNQTSYTIERDGVVLSYTYSTYDENSNQLTSVSDSGRAWIATYNEDNQRITLEIDYNGDGIYVSEIYTYEDGNQVKIEKPDENRTENKGYDINDNLIYSDIVINGETVQVETYTWQEFMAALK